MVVGHCPQLARAGRIDQDVVRSQSSRQRFGLDIWMRDVEVDNICLNRGRVQCNALNRDKTLGQQARMGMILGQPVDHFV